MPRCRHCHRTKPMRPRGLCYVCYFTPGIRELYPKKASKSNARPADPSPEEIRERAWAERRRKGELPA